MNSTSSLTRCGAAGALALALVCSTVPSSSSAQSDARAVASVDSIARSFRAAHHLPALVVGLIDSSGTRILPYGTSNDEDSANVTGDTRFEVGSVSKVFTSLLLASMVESGDVKLDDPIARYLPDSIKAPAYRGQVVTLRELSTHSSSLPRLPTNMAPANMSDPYVDYTADKLYAFLTAYDLPQAPDSHYEYSNLGAGLLGFLLARHDGGSYAEVLQKRVLMPLGLKDTYVGEPGDSTDKRMALSHSDGKAVPFWHFGALDGAGSVRSTASDMLRLLAAELHPATVPLTGAIELSQQIHFRASPQLSLGLAWHIIPLADSLSLYWHNGGTGGARSFVGFAPATGAGIVVLTNQAMPLEVFDQFALELTRAAMKR